MLALWIVVCLDSTYSEDEVPLIAENHNVDLSNVQRRNPGKILMNREDCLKCRFFIKLIFSIFKRKPR